jgi:uncharacterized repeat protein (TIGR03803 family)
MKSPILNANLLMAAIVVAVCGAAQAATPGLKTLYSFTGFNDGGPPLAPVTIGTDGVLYGTTFFGGIYHYGVVFSLTPAPSPGGSWTETVLHDFTGGTDGLEPAAPVVVAGDGVLYGTTIGAASSWGTVFSLAPPSSPGADWVETVLYTFTGGADGGTPTGPLLRASNGVFFGTTENAGANGTGVAFELIPPSSRGTPWTEKVLHSFGGPGDGLYPIAGVTYSRGSLYGMAQNGGANNAGMVFSLTPPASPGGAWTENVVYSFPSFGGGPLGGLTAASDGILYGAAGGGADGVGMIFSLTPPATSGASWTLTAIHDCTIPSGDFPQSNPLLIAGSGVLYGTMTGGGSANAGTLYQLKPPGTPGGAWTYQVLHNFTGTGAEGFGSEYSLALGTSGVLFGTTSTGGSYSSGTVFAFVP